MCDHEDEECQDHEENRKRVLGNVLKGVIDPIDVRPIHGLLVATFKILDNIGEEAFSALSTGEGTAIPVPKQHLDAIMETIEKAVEDKQKVSALIPEGCFPSPGSTKAN